MPRPRWACNPSLQAHLKRNSWQQIILTVLTVADVLDFNEEQSEVGTVDKSRLTCLEGFQAHTHKPAPC